MELFGVGPGEAILVLLITLIVVGPERFPQVAREGGRWFRMARRFTAEVTADLRGALDELEAEVKEQAGELKSVREIGESVESGLRETAADMRSLGSDTSAAASGASSSATTASNEAAASSAPGAPLPTEPEARRELDPFSGQPGGPAPSPAPEPDPSAAPASNEDLYRQVTEAYKEYHQPPAPTVPAETVADVSPPARAGAPDS